ncbi:MAG: Fic family protein [Patescibacteria group bacterium]|jgi:fido (protein-threonine AMPylation protein)
MIRLEQLNDTIMNKYNQEYQKIINIFLEKGEMQSSEVHQELIKKGDTSLVTVKRILSKMTDEGILIIIGSGRSTSYEISLVGRIFADIDIKKFSSTDPDKRYGLNTFNFDILSAIPSDIFTDDEINKLNVATVEYGKKIKDLPPEIEKKELERLVIELSWKSSKIEGNTYSLLDTEKLILENKEAVGHSREEAQMILNHKDAFNYIRENTAQFKNLTRKNLEELHAIIVKDLNVKLGLRLKPVGITGSIYHPLDNVHQITDAVEQLSATISRMNTPYAKAMIALLGISYIQPFNDGNKRTSRLMANALLLAHDCSALSYRSVDEDDYRSAILAFYELNSIMPLKQIFINQYLFAANNYAVNGLNI